MDSTTLVRNFDREAGIQLLHALDKINFHVKAAFWLFREESEDWRLYIATPLVSSEGPRAAYAKILEELRKIRIEGIGPSQLSVVDPTDSLVQLLSFAVHTGDTISEISLVKNTINGVYIEAAYIYRMNP